MTNIREVPTFLELVAMRRELPPPAERQAIRLKAGASRLALAKYLGVTQPSIRNWEIGKNFPSDRLIGPYLEALRSMNDFREYGQVLQAKVGQNHHE